MTVTTGEPLSPASGLDHGDGGRASWSAIGCEVSVLVTDVAAWRSARAMLRRDLADIDVACSRFRPDSELMRVSRSAGRPTSVSPLLAAAIRAALRAAELTDGLVDPTVGRSLVALGYDRDFASVDRDGATLTGVPAHRPAWREVRLDPDGERLTLPPGVQLDLGATAKALAADRAAVSIADTLGCGALVNLGGDIATAGPPPDGGWTIRVQERPGPVDRAPDGSWCIVALTGGGLATSSVRHRRWSRGGRSYHHIVDPRTGLPAASPWRTVSVTAATCLDANVASTAAIVLGTAAEAWLGSHRLPCRLVAADGGAVVVRNGWPEASV